MLLIDPARDGQIVDANLAALSFYGYSHDEMCSKHTWEINSLGRDVLPIMTEIASLPGGISRSILSTASPMGQPVMYRPTPGLLRSTVTN
jgi:PAS domain-containing protein